MRLKDNEVVKLLKQVNSWELKNSIETWDTEEALASGKSDMQIFMDELEYCIEMYEDGGTTWHYDLESAKEFLKETRGGRIPMDGLKPRYTMQALEVKKKSASAIVNEYKRLKKMQAKLNNR